MDTSTWIDRNPLPDIYTSVKHICCARTTSANETQSARLPCYLRWADWYVNLTCKKVCCAHLRVPLGLFRNLESSFSLTSQSWIQTVCTTQQAHHTVQCTNQQQDMHVARTVTSRIPLVPYSSCHHCFQEVLRGAKKLLFFFGLYASLVTILVEARTL